MSLESIINHILDEANAQKAQIVTQAHRESERIIQEVREEAERLYQDIFDKEKNIYESQKQKLIVDARLEAKKALLKNKQELIDYVFENLKPYLKKEKFKKNCRQMWL